MLVVVSETWPHWSSRFHLLIEGGSLLRYGASIYDVHTDNGDEMCQAILRRFSKSQLWRGKRGLKSRKRRKWKPSYVLVCGLGRILVHK